jgi:hypothetical protein
MLLVRIIGIVSLLFALAATGFCAWNYVGPYAWLAEAQMAMMGSYEVQLTFLCTLLGFMLPAMILVVPLRLAMGWQATQSAGADVWIRNNRGSLMLGVAAPMLLCVAGYFAFDAWSMGTLTPMNVAQVEAGAPPSRYVRIEGVLVPSMAMSMEEQHITTNFVPLSSTGRPPFTVFVQSCSCSPLILRWRRAAMPSSASSPSSSRLMICASSPTPAASTAASSLSTAARCSRAWL